MAEYKINMPKINSFVSIFTINTYTLIWGGNIYDKNYKHLKE